VGRRDVNRGHAKTKETECIRGFGEPDGKTGGNDGVGCVGEVICIYPYVPLKNLKITFFMGDGVGPRQGFDIVP
jgi:hypothetical protein